LFKTHGAVVLALLTVACGAPKPKQTTSQGALAPPKPPSISGALYRIDSARSELRVLVYRAGPMASFGHNHVIINQALDGSVVYAGGAKATVDFRVPAAGFVVDDAPSRRQEGADFAEDVPEDSKAGTLRNMLSASLLDAGQFPAITVQSVSITDSLVATLAVNVAGHESTLVVPFSVDIAPGRLTASGALTLRQSALGLTPFSVFLGALRVADEMRVKFKLVAVEN
jgi:hypothetical protein